MFEEIVDCAEYRLMMDHIKETLGEEAHVLADMLSHGLTKKAASRALNKPYHEVRTQVLQLRKVMTKFYSEQYEKNRG